MSLAVVDKKVLVTGANRGLGRALVEEALRRGAKRVYAGSRQPMVVPDERVTSLVLDVTDPAHPKYLKHIPGLEGTYEDGGAQVI